MAVQGNEPISAANVAAALMVSASDESISGKPVSSENLRAVLNRLGVSTAAPLVGTVIKEFSNNDLSFSISKSDVEKYIFFSFERLQNTQDNPPFEIPWRMMTGPGMFGGRYDNGWYKIGASYALDEAPAHRNTSIYISPSSKNVDVKVDDTTFTRVVAYKHLGIG